MTGATITFATGPDDLVGRFVGADDHVHLAATISRPNALTGALARRFAGRRSLTVSTTAVHSSAHALAVAGAARKVITGFLGDTYPTPRPNGLYRELGRGVPFEVELWSLLTYTQRLVAGALGQPFATTGSRLVGSDLSAAASEEVQTVTTADGQEVTLLTPLRPDWTLLHGVVADRAGNVVLTAPVGEGTWAAYAARRGVLASVERVVDDLGDLDDLTEAVIVPSAVVRGICVAEYGAHPLSLRGNGIAGVEGYLDDYEHLALIAEACRTAEGAQAWYDEWVGGIRSHDEYVAKVRETAGAALSPRAPVDPIVDVAPGAPATTQEQLVVLAARAVVALVRERGYDTLLAGIGTSHVAAWLAAEQLEDDGEPVQVVAELGLVGMRPARGDVFLFSQRHADRSASRSGIAEVLGGLVAAHDRCLGVLSAAEIGADGTLNTTMLPDGRWITGSGGANDIASSADCLVVAPASTRRFVPEVAHRTSPGERVRDIVTQLGRLHRDDPDQPFALTTWLQPPGGSFAHAQEAVDALTSWQVRATSARPEPEITADELARLRRLDPAGLYR